MDLSIQSDQNKCPSDTEYDSTAKYVLNEDTRLKKVLEKATKRQEMGTEYLQSRKTWRLYLGQK